MNHTDDSLDRELVKIEAVADVLIVLSGTEGLEKNTLAALGVIIQEAVSTLKRILGEKGK